MIRYAFAWTVCAALALLGCEEKSPRQISEKPEREVVAMQTRHFATNDTRAVLRGVVASFSDGGYIVKRADLSYSLVTAIKGWLMAEARVTPYGASTAVQLDVFVGSQFASQQVDAPEFYQKTFYDRLSTVLGLPALPPP
ncbi:MAG: hypothetical protein NTY59_01005 [Alphaproteobacteria bacterium]|nr:hypothetical protein [Alphaproteobacteria bacterium]